MSRTEQWLTNLGLEKYIPEFTDAEVAFADLRHLTSEDLKEIGLPVGPRRRVLEAIKQLNDDPGSLAPGFAIAAVDAPRATDAPLSATDAERRQLTVTFVDLVGSTEMATRLDAEDVRSVITSYQNTVAGIVRRNDGFVARYMGDGVLCYFGWPHANEDDAERAVRAGLEIISQVKTLVAPADITLATRVGIATGIVIVGDLVGTGAAQEAAVVGETPNLAARLQGLAKPNQLIVASETRSLIGSLFDLTLLGGQQLKGISKAVDAYLVNREKARESRFDAHHTDTLTPIVGRERELELILDCWARARADTGQMVVVSGEAGIGKSRIIRAVTDEIAQDSHVRITYQCSPYHTDSAFHPVIQQLNYAADIHPTDANSDRLAKLERLAGVGRDNVVLIAKLLGTDTSEHYAPLELSPAQLRARTIQTLIELLVRQAQHRPVLAIFEDLHWVDPTTLELLDTALDTVSDHKILVLVTARPTFQHDFGGHPIVSQFALNRLGKEPVLSIVNKLTGGKPVPDSVLQLIASRTDGVPLFVEELTKTVLESGTLIDDGDRFVLDGPLDALAIPSTLHDSLMARLDRLQPVKEVAQTAACIGREFHHRLLTTISPLPAAALDKALEGLLRAELIYRRGLPPEASYQFKHALVRDAAYATLLKERRRGIHASILASLEQAQEADPELLAIHAEAAGHRDEALRYRTDAGRAAAARSAYRESAGHYQHVLRIIEESPDRHDLQRVCIDVKLALRNSLVPLGEASVALKLAREAMHLAAELRDDARLARAASYLSILLWHTCVPREALAFGQEAVDRASALSDTGLQVSSAFFLGQVQQVLGNLSEARRLYERVVAQLEGDRAFHQYGLPFLPASHARAWLALILADLGEFDLGTLIARKGVEIAEEKRQPFSLQQAYWSLGQVHLHHERPDESLAATERALQVTSEWGLSVWEGPITAALGAAQVLAGDHSTGIASMENAIEAIDAGRTTAVCLASIATSLSHAYLLAHRFDDAAALADRAEKVCAERGHLADGARASFVQGEVSLRRPDGDTQSAQSHYLAALETAEHLGLDPLRAHCERGLASIDARRGEVRAARARLEAVIDAYHRLDMPVSERLTRQQLADIG